MQTTEATVKSILTRTTGFLKTVCSHSLQPYRGCAFGNALCGVSCYVQHNIYLTRGAPWGSFVEARTNAAEVYRKQYERERRWARKNRNGFGIFLSSSTDPFIPQEDRSGITRQLLEAMLEHPPDSLILQTHTHRVTRYLGLYEGLAKNTDLRFHLSIESDRDRLPGLPPPASSVDKRFAAATALKKAGHRVIITVAPLLPIADPLAFFARIAAVADAVIIDHFIEGDGTKSGSRTQKTALPAAMAQINADSVGLSYRDRMVEEARRVMPGKVGVNIEGFAGRFA